MGDESQSSEVEDDDDEDEDCLIGSKSVKEEKKYVKIIKKITASQHAGSIKKKLQVYK
jgi:hypothetical protein